VYSRRLKDKTLAFGHEGILYKRSFVMYDRETKSLWVHTSGLAVKGPQKGAQLKFLASTVMRWSDWKKRYPHTTVMEGRMARGGMGAFNLRRRRDRYGLSVGEGKNVKLYRFSALEKEPVVNDMFGKTPVVIVYDAEMAVARAYERGLRAFKWQDGKFVDETGLAWDPIIGKSAAGNAELAAVPATVWLIERWKVHYPKGEEHGQKPKRKVESED
jgi:hypothetical protein